jgi:Ca2+-binding EF-hand superfamily protein
MIMKTVNKTLALIALASSAAFAASDFDTLDVDGNGVVSKSEAAVDAKIMSQFKTLDVNGDGVLTEAEFSEAE